MLCSDITKPKVSFEPGEVFGKVDQDLIFEDDIKNVPEEETVPIKLEPGQLSLHHPLTVHSSGLNRTNNKRIGFVIQSYIGTNVEQTIGKTYVQQAKGKDQFKFHKHTKRPDKKMNNEDLILRNKANKELQKILYKDAKKIGKY